jgi:thiol-disulfide isomerase/thioredoxin
LLLRVFWSLESQYTVLCFLCELLFNFLDRRLVTDSPPKDDVSALATSGGSFWALLILLVAAAATLVAIQSGRPKPGGGTFVGKILPPLDAGGWINTKKPLTAEDLRDKIVLVDFWASDCVPCLRELPTLIEFNKRYRDRGVMVVGLSEQSGQRAVFMKNYIETRDGMDWPNGYDVRLAYEILGIYATPTYLLYDRSGRSVWGGHSLDGLEDAVTALLAKK